jgi:hypothetical protein
MRQSRFSETEIVDAVKLGNWVSPRGYFLER